MSAATLRHSLSETFHRETRQSSQDDADTVPEVAESMAETFFNLELGHIFEKILSHLTDREVALLARTSSRICNICLPVLARRLERLNPKYKKRRVRIN